MPDPRYFRVPGEHSKRRTPYTCNSSGCASPFFRPRTGENGGPIMPATEALRQPTRSLVIAAAAVPSSWPRSPTTSPCAASWTPPVGTRCPDCPAAPTCSPTPTGCCAPAAAAQCTSCSWRTTASRASTTPTGAPPATPSFTPWASAWPAGAPGGRPSRPAGGDEFAVAAVLPSSSDLADIAALRDQLQQPLHHDGLTPR